MTPAFDPRIVTKLSAISQLPVVVISRNPLVAPPAEDVREARIGQTLRDVAPETELPLLCSVVGVQGYILREQWDYQLQPGDIVVWHVDPPQNKDALRTVLAVVVAAVYVYFTWDTQGAAAILAGLSIGTTVSNILLPPTMPQGPDQQAAGNVYNTSLSGNRAALDQPIWKVCGRRKIYPPFAGEPYFEYIDDDDDDLDNAQYYYAVFAVGVGNHDIEQALIGGTPIRHFSDVLVADYLPPGTQPSLALANVNTCDLVNGAVLDSGAYIGGFAACKPQRFCRSVGIDIVATRGLGINGDPLTFTVRFEGREIDDFGVPIGPWKVIGGMSKTAATNTPQRWSTKIDFATAIRPEIRVVRTDVKNTSSVALHEIAWGGLRAYLDAPAPLNPDTAHYEVVLRSSDQLSQLSQRDIALMVRGKTRTWSAGVWTEEVYTRWPAWWALELATSAVWGLGLPDKRIDLASFAAFAATNEARQDRFDYVFDAAVDAWTALQLIARAGRARVFRRNGVLTLARDELATLAYTAFSPRNTMPESMVVSEGLPTRDMPDGFIIEYMDNRTWQWTPIRCPCPGIADADMANPIRKRIEGITGPIHARREGMYEAANLLYRRRIATCKTEMQGAMPTFMTPVRWLPEIPGYGQSGDVAEWDGATVLGLTEPVEWGASPLYITLVRDDGTLTTPAAVTPGPTAYDVVLAAPPDFDLVVDDGTRERPKYLLGTLDGCDELIKITAIRDGGKDDGGAQLYDIEGLVDDVRVHTADAALLPVPGVEQDPIPEGDAGEGGGTLPIVTLTAHGYPDLQDGVGVTGGGSFVTVTLNADGTYTTLRGMFGPGGFANEWLNAVVEPSVGATFEVYASSTLPAAFTGDALDAWLNLGTNRSWTITGPDRTPVTLRLQIRDVESGVVQADRTMTLQVNSADLH